ncbi:hypothetical protein [Photobacterium leiognathi]|uniref:hypothetical protein n=1 Tax=Photobacterium leiognathi TaxID=553611 RepID=UPI0029827C60|nr:hypothetical protein [Photobacterium leiognathi]
MNRKDRKDTNKLIQNVIGNLHKVLIADGMMGDRTESLSVEKQKQIVAEKCIDARIPLWVSKSAKGSVKFAKTHRNVSLADHAVSVMTGAVTFAAYWLVSEGCAIDDKLERQLFMIGLVGLLHDLNKLHDDVYALSDAKVLAELEALYDRWQLAQKLTQYGESLSAQEIFQLINSVEAGTALAGTEHGLVDTKLRQRCRTFVRLADQLDGCFYTLSKNGGVTGVLAKLSEWEKMDQGFISCLGRWHHLHLYDSAHPYLLDCLQTQLFQQCLEISGVSPLLSIHHDGALDVLIPDEDKSAVIDGALKGLKRTLLSGGFKIVISTTKKPDIKEGHPDWDELTEYLSSGENTKVVLDLLSIGTSDVAFFSEHLINDNYALRFNEKAQKAQSATIMPISPEEGDEVSIEFYQLSALISLLMRHTSQNKKIKVISEQKRLDQVEATLRDHGYLLSVPDVLAHPLSKSTWLAMQIAAHAIDDAELYETLLTLLISFYEGIDSDEDEKFTGIISGLKEDIAKQRVDAVICRFEALLNHKPYFPDQSQLSNDSQCCLITGEPTQGRITKSDALYSIKISQFSERNGRDAAIGDPKGVTMLSPTSYCEYQLRTRRHDNAKADMPVLICSPSTNGLFPGVRFTDETVADKDTFLSTYDLCREDRKNTVLYGPEIFNRRLFLARQESMPYKFVDQLDWLERVIKSVRRTGRPFHIFRGLATSRPEILYIDCLLPQLKKLCGNKSGFRIEELPSLYNEVRLFKTIIDARGSFTLIRAMLSLETKFGALCQVKCLLEDHVAEKEAQNKVQGLGQFRSAITEVNNRIYQLKSENNMTERDNGILQFAQLAARIQKGFGSTASRGEQTLLFSLVMDTVKTQLEYKLPMGDTLKNAIIGNIEHKLSGSKYIGRSEYRDGQSLLEACDALAECFLTSLWEPVLKSRLPNSQLKKQLMEIYRVEMLMTYQSRRNTKMTDEASE